ncbi:hypothetical protein [Poritiphilus flavus]|uniref:Membrane protein 6-pyruvoyl-tetrahydropterin synthase-related domain-containing protein n=1 Tax=Poritiphilus flavus TaxID=2697053 RepID=A0A6L9E760_9FLAO|nr:hypothetical protein [Poritiphilus flavus]NAS10432.1 hypothetical protein [Poritiphilus flavus]
MNRSNSLLILALITGLAFHGSAMFFTLEQTYDALIHLFFADHYAQNWFEHWEPRWYTGFTVQSYPPLVHQLIALLSYLGGLKFGLFSVALLGIVLFVTGIYRFSLLLTGNRKVSGYAALLAVFSSTFIETLHLFGQLPSIFGISLLLHALPDTYLWLKTGSYRKLVKALSLIAVTVCSHHVTPIFGMVFFIFPLIGMVLMDVSKEGVGSFKLITFRVFLQTFKKLFGRIIGFGFSALILIVICILPYWINTKNNPITQVPIPHGSRDNFLEVTSSGLVFFLIPWGVLLFLLPYLFYRFYSKRYLFFGLSFTLLAILGTGGTTPIPKGLLGENAFNILTLDRFTLWATIMALPIFGEFAYRLIEGDLRTHLRKRFGGVYHKVLGGLISGCLLFMVIFSLSLGYFRPSQPQKIKMLPIVNFLNQDQHDQWRYLTLGFGDQMAWLSAQTKAMTVDGNYHSARRLPELTSRAIERLENSKFKGVEGIGSLQQFLTVPEKYHLKYIFSNDKFYDPLLHFCGWQRLQQLDNGIMVWEKTNVPPLPSVLPREEVPMALKLMWGLIPMFTLLMAFILNIPSIWYAALKAGKAKNTDSIPPGVTYSGFSAKLTNISHFWAFAVILMVSFGIYSFYLNNSSQRSPSNVLQAYYDALDFKEFEQAHAYLSTDSGVSLAQFMLEISVTDGLLSSYAKLDGMSVRVLHQDQAGARAEITTNWITPLEKVIRTTKHDLKKIDGKWFITPEKPNNDLPPDQLFSANQTAYYNHGRRRITTEQTLHEDVLQQPVLEVLSAKLVRLDSEYAIVGELQNIDNIPADVVVSATLYDHENNPMARHSSKDVIKHKLMPKEVTPFKINFEGIAWLDTDLEAPAGFDPSEFTTIEFEEIPSNFDIQAAANVATGDLYKATAIQQLDLREGLLRGQLFNSGIQEVTIPQLIVSYYDESNELLWVDHKFVKNGVRVQRKQSFEYETLDLSDLQLLAEGLQDVYVNGLPNQAIAQKRFPERHKFQNGVQALSGKGFSGIRLQLNSYIGNPK